MKGPIAGPLGEIAIMDFTDSAAWLDSDLNADIAV
jgi:hypothetical protein